MSGKPRDTTRRDCPHNGKHQHGTGAAYQADNCRCDECRRAIADAARTRYRLRAYGRWPQRVPADQIRARIEALIWLGWSIPKLARHAHLDEVALRRFLWSDTLVYVTPKNAAKITATFDALSGTRPPERTHGERQTASRMRNLARRRGYLPPLALDAEPAVDAPGLDEVAVERFMRGTLHHPPLRNYSPELIEAVRRMASTLSDRQIGDRVGLSGDAIGQLRRRNGISQGSAAA